MPALHLVRLVALQLRRGPTPNRTATAPGEQWPFLQPTTATTYSENVNRKERFVKPVRTGLTEPEYPRLGTFSSILPGGREAITEASEKKVSHREVSFGQRRQKGPTTARLLFRSFGRTGLFDFMERIFTAEMPRRNGHETRTAQGWRHAGQDFSVTNSSAGFRSPLLACGNYIRPDGTGTQREIDAPFDGALRQEATVRQTDNRKYAFRIHVHDTETKPAVHARPLNGDAPDTLLQKMAETIRRFLAALPGSTQLP